MSLTIANILGQSDSHVMRSRDLPVALAPQAARAFWQLRKRALKEGIDLWPASGFRSYETQVAIWNQKWQGARLLLNKKSQPLRASDLTASQRLNAILAWSAPPGASRHHWGSDLDVYDRQVVASGYRLQLIPDEYGPHGPMAQLGAWLTAHLPETDFFRPYRKDRGGVQPEPWHLSHQPSALECSRRLRVTHLIDALKRQSEPWSALLIKRMPDIYRLYVRSIDSP